MNTKTGNISDVSKEVEKDYPTKILKNMGKFPDENVIKASKLIR